MCGAPVLFRDEPYSPTFGAPIFAAAAWQAQGGLCSTSHLRLSAAVTLPNLLTISPASSRIPGISP